MHLLCVDVHGTVYNLHGVWFASQLRSLPWLVPRECRVRIDFALLTAMDTRHGILRLEKTEHTIVSVRAEPKAARTPTRRVSFSAAKPAPTWASKASQWKGIEETRRIQALQQSAEVYCSQWVARHESTADTAPDVIEQPIYLACAVVPLRRVEMAHPVQLSKDDIRSTVLGEDLWTLYRLFVVDVLMDYDVFMETMTTTTSTTMMDGGDRRTALPWTPVARETDLLPTHMVLKALFICPTDHSADDDASKKLLADSVAILHHPPTDPNATSSNSMLWDVLVHVVVGQNGVVASSSSSAASTAAFHVVVKQWHSA